MSAFAAAVNAIFQDPNMSELAQYLGRGDRLAYDVRVIRQSPDRESEWNGGRFVRDTVMIDVRMSDVPELRQGDNFMLGGELVTVQGDPGRDAFRLVWKAMVRAV